jgi:hypothetical protein
VRLLAVRPLLAYCASLGWYWRWLWRSRWNVDWQRKPKFSEKTCPSAIFVHHKIPHEQTRVRTLAAAVGSRRLTAWAMARPNVYFILGSFSVRFPARVTLSLYRFSSLSSAKWWEIRKLLSTWTLTSQFPAISFSECPHRHNILSTTLIWIQDWGLERVPKPVLPRPANTQQCYWPTNYLAWKPNLDLQSLTVWIQVLLDRGQQHLRYSKNSPKMIYTLCVHYPKPASDHYSKID